MSALSQIESLHRDLLHAGVFPSKRFSQNFLIEDEAVNLLVKNARIDSHSHVLEIGAGTGAVTQALAATGATITAMEVHPKLIGFLQKKFAETKNVHILGKDFLHVDLQTIPFTHVCCSPPYAIADDIMLGLFQHGFQHASMIWQYEFADKLLATPGSKDYGPLSVLCQYFYEGEISKKISPQSFYPSPQQFSAILSLHARKRIKPIPDYKKFVLFLRTFFRFKNKMVPNAMQKTLPHLKAEKQNEIILKKVQELKLHEIKVFLLEPEEIVKLYFAIHELI